VQLIPLDDLADFCEENAVAHLDGAYGALANHSERCALNDTGSRAHSLSLDPHKFLFIPLEADRACTPGEDMRHLKLYPKLSSMVPDADFLTMRNMAPNCHGVLRR
jgi:glutamate/tyrosine decarboxylase-like PLP-dependent enzyme